MKPVWPHGAENQVRNPKKLKPPKREHNFAGQNPSDLTPNWATRQIPEIKPKWEDLQQQLETAAWLQISNKEDYLRHKLEQNNKQSS